MSAEREMLENFFGDFDIKSSIETVQNKEELLNIPVLSDMSYDTVVKLINKYFEFTKENKGYDNKEEILKCATPIFKNSFIGINNLNCSHIIDFFRYIQYYKNDLLMKQNDIIAILSINRDTEESITRNDIRYTWNKRKDYFNVIRHKLTFTDAVSIISQGDKVKDREENTYKVFVINSQNKFLIIELELSKNEYRLISFRKTTLKEYNKAKEDEYKWNWIEKK